MYSRMDNCLVIPSVSDHVLNPAECIVQRDISPIFHCLNDTKRYVNTFCYCSTMKIHPLLGTVLLIRNMG